MISSSSTKHTDSGFFTSLPKVELHRHLEGSLRLQTLLEIARTYDLGYTNTDSGLSKLRQLVQISNDDVASSANFLSKFETLRLFYRSPEVIQRITREAIEDAARDNVRYMELRFTPVALSRSGGFSLGEVMDWVIEGMRLGENEFGTRTRLIVSVNRHEELTQAEKIVQLACERIGSGIVGLDLAGNEAQFSGIDFAGLFREAKQAGLQLTIHAGEWGDANNVRDAILLLGADRIGHGVLILHDANIIQLARERQIPFEICITSNYQSGVSSISTSHPALSMQAQGLIITINTDDPGISQITLGHEYWVACEKLGLSLEALSKLILAAARVSFLPGEEKAALSTQINSELQKLIAQVG